MANPRRRTDAASKLLFLGDVIADLVRIALPALAAELDLDRIEPLPTEFIGLDRSRRIGDAAYRIPFKECDDGPVRTAVASAEFQDANDHGMLDRVRGYTDRMLADYRRRGLIGEDEHSLVLPFVIHTGAGRWTAADGGEPLAAASAEIVREVALYQPQAYIPVDIGGRVALPSGAPDNRFLAAARLVRSRTVPALAEQLRSEWRLFATPGYRPLREGMHAWVEEALLGAAESGAELPSFEEMEGAKEAEMTYLFKDKIDAFREEARAEGREEGIQVARREQRDLLVAMAIRRFGAAAGRRLADALDDRPSADVLSETGDLILACETAAEFVDRLAG